MIGSHSNKIIFIFKQIIQTKKDIGQKFYNEVEEKIKKPSITEKKGENKKAPATIIRDKHNQGKFFLNIIIKHHKQR